jgi:hypothetical protein
MPETKTKTIEGKNFEISQPYEEGHVISAIEARVLNQTRSENIGNNVRAKLKEALEAGAADDALAAMVAEVDANYVFTAAGTRAAARLDPIEREARKMARELLRTHLAESGRKLTTPPDGSTKEEWDEKIEAEVDRIATLDTVLEAAKKEVAAKSRRAEKLKDALGGSTL